MGLIPEVNLPSRFTNRMYGSFVQRARPKSFLLDLFPTVFQQERDVEFESMNIIRDISIDVPRGTEGNANAISESTVKQYKPPYHKEYLNLTELDKYDAIFLTSGTPIRTLDFNAGIRQAVRGLSLIEDKIQRARIKQIADFLRLGEISILSGSNIDYKRTYSNVENAFAGIYDMDTFSNNFNDPGVIESSILGQLEHMRINGKLDGNGDVNAIMGGGVLGLILNDATIKERLNFRWRTDIAFRPPETGLSGGTLHGSFSLNEYIIFVWTFADSYKDPTTGNDVKYIKQLDMHLLPPEFEAQNVFAGVPELPMVKSQAEQAIMRQMRSAQIGFVPFTHLSEKVEAFELGFKTAPLFKVDSPQRVSSLLNVGGTGA